MTNRHTPAIRTRLRSSRASAAFRFGCRKPRMKASAATRIGSSTAEYLLDMAAPSESPVIRVLRQVGTSPCFQNRYNVSRTNTETGTSVVMRVPFARRFGENAYNPAATRPAGGPKRSRAHRNVTAVPRAASRIMGTRPQKSKRSASLRYRKSDPNSYSDDVFQTPVDVLNFGWISKRGNAAI